MASYTSIRCGHRLVPKQTASENLAVLLFTHQRGTVNGVITYYPARGYNKQVDGIEVSIQKHYTFGSQTIALRVNGALNWVLGDHLGSTSVTANADGSFKSQVQYTAFGEIRASLGVTDSEYRYTGQLRQAELGLYYYVARWYDPYLNHFTQPDSIVPNPGNISDWNRYSYVRYNPLRYTDPSGHEPCGTAPEPWRSICLNNLGRSDQIKLPTDRKEAIKLIAKVKDIRLSSGDQWDYADRILSGGQPVFGWTPSKPNDPYIDGNGNPQHAPDTSVFITGSAFDACEGAGSIECLAGLMAHEATHSHIEAKIETQGQQRSALDVNAAIAEEILADFVAEKMGDPKNFFYYHKIQMLGLYTDSRTPSKYLEDFYTISLFDIHFLVYGK